MKKALLGGCLAAVAVGMAAAEDAAPLFPFVISYDAPENVVNMSRLLDAPAGSHGRVRAEGGHFVTDAGRIRFHGTNLTGPANFPTHEEADRLAARLARFGFNCVRLHYFDADYGNFMEPEQAGIIADDFRTRRRIDEGQRDRQDYLIAALKKRGIYVDINLHIARTLDSRDGFGPGTPWANKGVDAFDPRIIAAEKEYARDLLTHVNPYTKLAYTEDPCVAMVELNNEDSIFAQYLWGGFNGLGEPYATELRNQWNDWLVRKYKTDEAVGEAYEIKDTPLGPEQIEGETFGKAWILDTGSAKADAGLVAGVVTINVTQGGNEYFPKLYRRVQVKAAVPYTVSFSIRMKSGDGNGVELGFGVATRRKGWDSLGLLGRVQVSREWKQVSHTFFANASEDAAEIQWTRFPVGTYEIKDLSFRRGGTFAFKADTSILKGAMPVVKLSEPVPPAMKADFYQFLADTEQAYWTGMRRYLVEELKLRAPVSGTQLGYSPPHIMAQLDYVDDHEYWNHPGPVSKDWKIRTSSMVNNTLACIVSLASSRVAGKPYTVSEYNHPYPQPYGAEGQPLLRAYGAMQGWDGVFEYTYNHRQKAEPGFNTYFFSIVARTDVLAHMPACAAMFLRGDVKEGAAPLVAALPYDKYFRRLVGSNQVRQGISAAGYDPCDSLRRRVSVDVTAKTAPDIAASPKGGNIVSDTGELTLNRGMPGACYWTADTPNTKVFTGFPRGRTVKLGEVSLSIGETRLGWATVSLTSHDATGFGAGDKKARILLAATGVSHNDGADFEKGGDATIFTRGENWGHGPVMNEGIPLVVALPSSATSTKCFALDESGNRRGAVPVAAAGQGCSVSVGPQYKTVWYEIAVGE
jgi:hypothetical protein